MRTRLDSVQATADAMSRCDYIVDQGLATSLFLALEMGKALFLEGEPGVGKTEVGPARTSPRVR